MLKIITDIKKLTMPLLIDNEAFFSENTKYQKDEEYSATEMKYMKEIDGISIKKGNYIKTKFGETSLDSISTGLKTLLNLCYLQKNDLKYAVNITECGPNVLKLIFTDFDIDNELLLEHNNIPKFKGISLNVDGTSYDSASELYEYLAGKGEQR